MGLGSVGLPEGALPIRISGYKTRRICLPDHPTYLDTDIQYRADLSLLRPPLVQTINRWYGNILPVFHRLRLSASTKEPANPGRIYLPQETLGFRRWRFSLHLSLLNPTYSLATAPLTLPGQLQSR